MNRYFQFISEEEAHAEAKRLEAEEEARSVRLRLEREMTLIRAANQARRAREEREVLAREEQDRREWAETLLLIQFYEFDRF